jgi:2-C-methyl-D-erythritol 4-phosphate cytidylyltransferase
MGVAALVLAGGSGRRFGAQRNKVYLPLAGRTVLAWSLRTFARMPEVERVVLVSRPDDREFLAEVLADELVGFSVEVVPGGDTRQGSELSGLRHLADGITAGAIDTVLIHDGARPLVSAELVTAVIEGAREYGGAVPGLRRDGLARVDPADPASERLAGPEPGPLVAVQTPQGFAAAPLLDAYRRADADGYRGTDTASCVRRYTDLPVRWVPGEEHNIKITYAHDLVVAETLLRDRPPAD